MTVPETAAPADGPLSGAAARPRARLAAWAFWIGLCAMLVLYLLGYPDGSAPVWMRALLKAAFNALAALWIHADARDRGWGAGGALAASVCGLVLVELAVPVYLVRSRGWRGALRTLPGFVLRVVLTLLAAMLALVLWGLLTPAG